MQTLFFALSSTVYIESTITKLKPKVFASGLLYVIGKCLSDSTAACFMTY